MGRWMDSEGQRTRLPSSKLLHQSGKDQSRSKQGISRPDQRGPNRLNLAEPEATANMPKLVDEIPRSSKHVTVHARGAGTRGRGKTRAVLVQLPGVRRSERLKRKVAVEAGGDDEAAEGAAASRSKRGRTSQKGGDGSDQATELKPPGVTKYLSRKRTPGFEDAVKETGEPEAEGSTALKPAASKRPKTAVPLASGPEPEQCIASSLENASSPLAILLTRQSLKDPKDSPLTPERDTAEKSIEKTGNRTSNEEEVKTPVAGRPSSDGPAPNLGGSLAPDSNPPSSIARLAAALEGFAYQRGSVSDTSSVGVRNRTPFPQRKPKPRSVSPARRSLSAGLPATSPSVSFEGEHFPQGSANSTATGGSVRDQHGDSQAAPRKVSKRRQRASLKVIAAGEKVRQAALGLVAEGKRVTAEGIRELIPEEAEKKGTEGLEGGCVKRPAGMVDPDWVPPVSPYGLIQEELWRTPWKLLVACLLLNVTSGGQMRRVIWNLFELIPTPEAAIAADTEAMGRIIHSLGLQNKRAATIQRFSKEYLEHLKDPAAFPLSKVHGIGKYAADAHAIFCEGRWQEVLPHDHVLNRYWEWMWETRGEGAAFRRDEE